MPIVPRKYRDRGSPAQGRMILLCELQRQRYRFLQNIVRKLRRRYVDKMYARPLWRKINY